MGHPVLRAVLHPHEYTVLRVASVIALDIAVNETGTETGTRTLPPLGR